MIRKLVSALILLAIGACSGDREGARTPAGAAGPERIPWALAIHGGAGAIPRDMPRARVAGYQEGLERALRAGAAVLERGGPSLDAVEQAIRTLEDDPRFNAGRGAVFNRDGRHELDASIMDGATLACGAVAGVTAIRNPISLARLVMERTPHVLLGGDGAERFAAEQGIGRVEQDYFFTEERYRSHRETLAPAAAAGGGTVGAVALDRAGNLAAGTSTGGLTNKMPGRVGDSPIIGAGTYAKNGACAVSATGRGEEFIRHAVGHTIALLVEQGTMTPREAAEHVVQDLLAPGDGGVIVLDRKGDVAMAFSTVGMYRAAADATGRFEVRLWE